MSLPTVNFVACTHTKSAWLNLGELVDDHGLRIVYVPSVESREVEDTVGGSLKSQPSKYDVIPGGCGNFIRQICANVSNF
jgi:hypothetical protein